MKKTIFILVMLLLAGSLTAYAQESDITIRADLNDILKISYETEADGRINVGVMKTTDYETLSEKTEVEAVSLMMFMDQSDSGGEFTFLSNAQIGTEYTVSVRNENELQAYSKPFVWYDADTLKNGFFSALTAAVEKEAVLNVFDNTYKGLLDLYCGDYSKLSTESKAACGAYFAANGKNSAEGFVANAKRVVSALGIADVADSEITEVSNLVDEILTENAEILGISSLSEFTQYSGKNTAFKSTFAKRLNNSRICDASAFSAYFREQYYLTELELTVNYSQVKPILTAMNSSCGLDSGIYFSLTDTKAYDTELTGAAYADKSSLEDYLTAITATKGNNGGNSGGSGGSGGGGGSVFASGGTQTALPAQTSGYTDLSSGHWAYEAVSALSQRGVISGYGDGSFKPGNYITRAEFLTLLLEAFSFVDSDAVVEFADVGEDAWYCKYAATGEKYGIISGYEDNTFRANDKVTRQDACCMVVNLADVRALALAAGREYTEFQDSSQIAAYARDSVAKLYSAGVINGYGEGEFLPQGQLTRAEAAQLVFSLIKLTA
ncbi:MAG: S-layer homology domain-containing protein [Clostridia bacterium]|nr:S-layer homology domain-containing protein [Clostridia bacterium]